MKNVFKKIGFCIILFLISKEVYANKLEINSIVVSIEDIAQERINLKNVTPTENILARASALKNKHWKYLAAIDMIVVEFISAGYMLENSSVFFSIFDDEKRVFVAKLNGLQIQIEENEANGKMKYIFYLFFKNKTEYENYKNNKISDKLHMIHKSSVEYKYEEDNSYTVIYEKLEPLYSNLYIKLLKSFYSLDYLKEYEAFVGGSTPHLISYIHYLSSANSVEVNLEKARMYRMAERYTLAIKYYEMVADTDSNVYDELAIIYETVKDFQKARKAYEISANRGNTYAMISLYKYYCFGHFNPKAIITNKKFTVKSIDTKLGIEWAEKAANKKNPEALKIMGEIYEYGNDLIDRDLKKSITFYEASCAIQKDFSNKKNKENSSCQKYYKLKNKLSSLN